ncbi:MAG: crotonase/enoyl-CoA hydratase family protein [Chloroflexi bacterium]|nr:MAG: crotonase/enoyl-CoA hydratase family protein [Chloroflexota bacterium]
MTIQIERREAVMIVTLDRPDRRNAVDGATAREMSAAFRSFDADPGLSVAVLTGAGGNFCAGFDLKALADGTGPEVNEGDGPMGPTYLRLGKPVIAAIEGYCVAGGMELALWCDLRIAANNAVLGIFNRRFGVPLVDGGTIRLARIAGQGLAMDLILTGRQIEAEEAERHGLINQLVEPGRAREEAIALAQRIAGFPQTGLRNDRLSLLEQWGLPLDQALENELRWGRKTMESGEALAGARRFASGEGRRGRDL